MEALVWEGTTLPSSDENIMRLFQDVSSPPVAAAGIPLLWSP